MKKIFLLLFITILYSCDESYVAIPKDDEILDGPIDGLSTEESARFLKGDAAFNEVFTRETGLGSTFVATSCISCHAGDGKGHPFTTLTRFGQPNENGNIFLHLGGPQLQNRALPGFMPEQIPLGATFSKFTPPANTGLGFLQFITDADILAMSDPNDANGDGISGVPNWILIPEYINPVDAISQNGKHIGRFGKKAATFNLLHQTVTAYNQDIGITSTYNPIDVYTNQEIDPEIATNIVNDVDFYLKTLKAPPRRNSGDSQVIQGENLFNKINCVGCHKADLSTGYSPISALSFKTFSPYTDLLLHDMGSELNDGYTEGSAKTYEWRTPPLWGLGLSENAQGGNIFLMHDGRARSIEQAISMHGGEATNSKTAFNNLSQGEKNALIKFLKSL
ncbi:di-heme oxidoredictase family protein [Flavobacterium psychrophilum]|uniref:di-heme oxidoredictase family protein n=3 Tax=Flavobacterium psychrophilum TaxID=96345 RepID=UPI000B7C2066|nr:di-heme oxidoredictase family protein [Flavobacterium psychrophilum]MCB6062259.1 c-type cytochrome [Flavobacterium psychrophilum]MCB6099187.1 c-type cytochrome [Flavobacterium psychrophilum]SNB42843.1 putative lipoprotein [Flavobacterium psychrophilum]